MRRVFAALLGAILGCTDPPPPPAFNAGRAVYDTAPLAVTSFLSDPAVRQRVLGMPFGEAAARLGSLRFVAQSNFLFSRGGDDYEQHDRYEAAEDAAGSFAVLLETPDDELAVTLVDEYLYLRQGKGHTRKKPRREVEAEAWTELAFASLRQTLEVFRPQLAFTDESIDTLAGRGTLRYRLVVSEHATEALPPLPALPSLPIGVPSRWRELKKPLDVTGSLWIDTASGVPVALKLEGSVEISDRQLRPTQLRLSYQGQLKDIGSVGRISAPPSIPELQREVPPRDLLGFFREHLPAPASDPGAGSP